jgi:hypothetical protein
MSWVGAASVGGLFDFNWTCRFRDNRLRASQVVSRRDLAPEPRWLAGFGPCRFVDEFLGRLQTKAEQEK